MAALRAERPDEMGDNKPKLTLLRTKDPKEEREARLQTRRELNHLLASEITEYYGGDYRENLDALEEDTQS